MPNPRRGILTVVWEIGRVDVMVRELDSLEALVGWRYLREIRCPVKVERVEPTFP